MRIQRRRGISGGPASSSKFKKVCLTDPDATMATTARNRRLEPSYEQYGVVDDLNGVIVEVEVTTGEVNKGQVILDRLEWLFAAGDLRRILKSTSPSAVFSLPVRTPLR